MGNYHILNVILQVPHKVGTVDVRSCGCPQNQASSGQLLVSSISDLCVICACSDDLLLTT